MPWLADLVQSHENAFSMLPVQCLCEFLLSEVTPGPVSVSADSLKHQQLVHHLRTLLRAQPQVRMLVGLAESSVSIASLAKEKQLE